MNLWDRIHTAPAPVPLERVEAFDVSDTIAAIFESPEDRFPVPWLDLPNVAPPFQKYFMFGRLPKCLRAMGVETILPSGAEIGALFDAQKTDTGWIVEVYQVGGDTPMWQPWIVRYRVRTDGQLELFENGKLFEAALPADLLPQLTAINCDAQEAVNSVCNFIYPYVFATTLLHCKNVRASRVHVPAKLLAARFRRGHRTYSYSILDLVSLRHSLHTETALPSGASLRQALHICRGHFKHYQEGAGLFGKHTGTYWWNSIVRGSADNGVHIKDYRVLGSPKREK